MSGAVSYVFYIKWRCHKWASLRKMGSFFLDSSCIIHNSMHMKDIKIYTTNYCPYCIGAKEMLKQKGIAFEEIDVSDDTELRQKLADENDGYQTVPMIFVDGKFIGGFMELQKLEVEGKL